MAQEVLDENNINEDFEELIYSMKNVDGEDYFIQIYVPNPESEPSSSTIYTVPFWEDDDFNSYTIYKNNGDLSIDSLTLQDTSTIMVKHMWVVSVNEIVDRQGELPVANTGLCSTEDSIPLDELERIISPNNTVTSFSPKYKTNAPTDRVALTTVTLHHYFESWFSGKIDIYCRRYLVNANVYTNAYIDANGNKKVGDEVYDTDHGLKRSVAKEMIEDNIAKSTLWIYTYFDNWLYFSNYPLMAYVFYERDPLRSPRNATIDIVSSPYKGLIVPYRSTDVDLCHGVYSYAASPPWSNIHFVVPRSNSAWDWSNVLAH